MDHNTDFKQIYHTPFTQRSQSMLPQKDYGKDKANLSLWFHETIIGGFDTQNPHKIPNRDKSSPV